MGRSFPDACGRVSGPARWIRGGTAFVVLAVFVLPTACAVTIPDSPLPVLDPQVALSLGPALDSDQSPFLTPPREAPSDVILDSRWARHPLIAERTHRWIDFWTGAGAGDFTRYLTRMTSYASLIDADISAGELPNSLRYLPIVESGYSPSARSSAGAVGLWQFMSGTAREVGLAVGPLIDERRDPVRATPKALGVLSSHRQRFGSWFLALAAYNAGPGRISGLLRRHAALAPLGDSLYVALYGVLPRETRDFIPKLLAASELARSPERYGFRPESGPLFRFEEVTVPDATSVDVIARAAEVSQDLIEALNPQLLRGFTPANQETLVRVPPGRGAVFRRNYTLIPAEERVSFLEHKVASGETFGHIALRYGVPVDVLRAANPTVQPRFLQIGRWLIVPRAPTSGE